MDELIAAFDIAGISKSPSAFDMEKLNYFNANYLRGLSPEEFAREAEPWIRRTVKNEAYDAAAIAALLQARCERLSDIPEKVDFFDALPEYGADLYTNKKSKTNSEVSLEMLKQTAPVLSGRRMESGLHSRRAGGVGGKAGREERHPHVALAHRCGGQGGDSRRRGRDLPYFGEGRDPAPDGAGDGKLNG